MRLTGKPSTSSPASVLADGSPPSIALTNCSVSHDLPTPVDPTRVHACPCAHRTCLPRPHTGSGSGSAKMSAIVCADRPSAIDSCRIRRMLARASSDNSIRCCVTPRAISRRTGSAACAATCMASAISRASSRSRSLSTSNWRAFCARSTAVGDGLPSPSTTRRSGLLGSGGGPSNGPAGGNGSPSSSVARVGVGSPAGVIRPTVAPSRASRAL